jgi:hypothetical protein
MKLGLDGVDDVTHVDEAARRNLRRSFIGVRNILIHLPEARLVEAEIVADQA